MITMLNITGIDADAQHCAGLATSLHVSADPRCAFGCIAG